MSTFASALALVAALAGAGTGAAPAAAPRGARAQAPGEASALPSGALEIGFLAGAASGKVFDPRRTPTDFVEAIVRVALHFPPTGSSWRQGNFALVAEAVPFFTIDQAPRATGGGGNLLVRYTWAGRRWRPSFLAGAGILATDEKVPPGETGLNFSPQGGVALLYLAAASWGIGGEYRFHHISNNGRTESNPGINSHLLLIGVSWFP